ncbi:MAG TPA: tRNA (N(6)-L-threonylcarbamoyladenosine(37)-C(2))-methylthiotransferase MtaB [Vicinamibacteria bacterium]
MYRASFYTLGCRLNQTETAVLAGAFKSKGYSMVEWGETTDLAVVNTCSVTEHGESRCRNVIRQALRHSPQAFVVVTGCYAQVGLEALRKIPGVDMIVGTEYKLKFPAFIDRPRKLPEPVVLHSQLIDDADFEVDGTGEYTTTRANLKVQDGCDFFCSFCIIPFTRGRERSRKVEDVLREARELVARGHRELVLTGVNIGRYQADGHSFYDLVRRLEEVEGLRRVRITSIEPTTVEPALVDHMVHSQKLCHYFHVPIQSGDDSVLLGMNRRYATNEYREFIEDVARRVPDVGLGTDLIVGFPGETEASFARTETLLEELPLAYFHVFSYSKRYGTRAARQDGHVHPEVIKERSQRLRALSRRKRRQFGSRYLGRKVEVLFEQQDENGLWTGLTDNYLRVGVVSSQPLRNRLVDVVIQEANDEMALGVLADAAA